MARPIWTGSITFGLVAIPVALFSVTEDHTGKEVDYADIVRGHQVGDGVVDAGRYETR